MSDHLLALRALLEPEGPRSGRLAARLAALCALPPDRPALAERVAHAISLERSAVSGLAPRGRDVDLLVDELAGNLSALLRDVLCGHLDSDLVAVAEGLIESAEVDEAQADAEAEAHAAAEATAGLPAAQRDPDPAIDTIDQTSGAVRRFQPPVYDEPGEADQLAGEWPAADPFGGQLF